MGISRTPADWTAGEIPTAAKMNAEIRDLWVGLQSPWVAYVPTWTTAGSAPALGNGTLTGRYFQLGKTIFFRIDFVAGSTTTFGTGTFVFSLPSVTPLVTPGSQIASAMILDSSAGSTRAGWGAIYIPTSGGGVALRDSNGVAPTGTAPFTWAVGDVVTVNGVYEAS